MSTAKYGATSWDDVEISVNRNANKKDVFLSLENGANIVRILTKPYEFLVHQYKTNPKDPGFGQKVMSSIHHGSDPLVDRGMRPKRKWLVGVIDRKTSSYRILEIGPGIFKFLQNLVRDEDWGDPSSVNNGYDVNIQKDKDAAPNDYYSVIAKPKKPLSAADLELREQVDLEDLERRCKPPTPEQVLQRVMEIDAKSPNGPPGAAEKVQADEPVTPRPRAAVSSDEGDFDFPSAD